MTDDQAFIASVVREVRDAAAQFRDSLPGDQINAEIAAEFARSLVERLLKQHREPRLQQMIIPCVDRELTAVSGKSGLVFPRRRLLRPPRPPIPLRREGWQQDAQLAFDCWDRLNVHLDQRRRGRRGEHLAGLILASAILRGSLLRPAAWPALLTDLVAGDLQLYATAALPDLPWVDLALPLEPSAATNHSPTAERLRFFPDIVTLGLLRQWAQRDGRLGQPPASSKAALAMMLRALFGAQPPGCPDPDRFAAAAMAPWEDHMDHPLPYMLTSVASGQLTGFSASDESWQHLQGLPAKPRDRQPARRRKARMTSQCPAGSTTPSASLAALQTALTFRPKTAQKQTRGPVEQALTAISRDALTPAGHALRIWYLHLLQSRRAVSTLQRYHSAIARQLLVLCQDQDPALWDSGRMEEMISLVLATEDATGLDTPFAIGRLMQFCSFAAHTPELRWPEVDPAIAAGHGEGRHPRIRTALISAAQIATALSHWPAQEGRELREIEHVAFLLAVRGGLRLGELEALTVGDVTPGPEGSVLVHATIWADIKSSAGRRKVPVRMLTTGDEARLLERFFVRRLREASSLQEQLLARPSGLFGTCRFDRESFHANLRQVLGMTPHDLRHGAISNLALLLMVRTSHPKILHRLTGWPPAQQKRILTGLMGASPDPRRALTQLARIAGHARAETTVRSYIHLCDLGLGLTLRANPETMPADQAARWLGLNRRNLPSAAQARDYRLEQARPAILKGLKIRQLIASAAPPQPILTPIASKGISPDLVMRILRARDRGTPARDLADQFALNRGQLRQIETMAKRLQELRTGKPGRLVPPLPRRDMDRLLCQKVMAALARAEPDEQRAWAIQTLKAVREKDLCFASRQQFESWRQTVAYPLDEIDWRVTCPAGRLRAQPVQNRDPETLSMIALSTPAVLTLCAWAAGQPDRKCTAALAALGG